MSHADWFILIYQVADPEAQASLRRALLRNEGLIVECSSGSGDHYVVVEAPVNLPALRLHEIVVASDPAAELVDTHFEYVRQPLGTAR